MASTALSLPQTASPAVPAVKIWGLCPKCRNWFDCDAWFDRSVPTPCCPACALGPGAIRYEHPDRGGRRPVRADAPELWIG